MPSNLEEFNSYLQRHKGAGKTQQFGIVPRPSKIKDDSYKLDKYYFYPKTRHVVTEHSSLLEAVGKGMRPIPDLAIFTSLKHNGKVMVQREKNAAFRVRSIKHPELPYDMPVREMAAKQHAQRVKSSLNIVGWDAKIEHPPLVKMLWLQKHGDHPEFPINGDAAFKGPYWVKSLGLRVINVEEYPTIHHALGAIKSDGLSNFYLTNSTNGATVSGTKHGEAYLLKHGIHPSIKTTIPNAQSFTNDYFQHRDMHARAHLQHVSKLMAFRGMKNTVDDSGVKPPIQLSKAGAPYNSLWDSGEIIHHPSLHHGVVYLHNHLTIGQGANLMHTEHGGAVDVIRIGENSYKVGHGVHPNIPDLGDRSFYQLPLPNKKVWLIKNTQAAKNHIDEVAKHFRVSGKSVTIDYSGVEKNIRLL